MLLRLLPPLAIVALIVYVGAANIQRSPPNPADRVDDDPDPVSRARTQCAQIKDTRDYRKAPLDSDFLRLTEDWCEEQLRDVERIKFGR